jgi:hypothetical protein
MLAGITLRYSCKGNWSMGHGGRLEAAVKNRAASYLPLLNARQSAR